MHRGRGPCPITKEAYRQAMLIDVSDQKILEALERLYTVRMRWEDLIEILNQQAAILTEDNAVVEKYLQIGDLWETRLQSPDRAIEAYRQALALDEGAMDALRALEGLFAQQERWYEILDVFEMMLGVVNEPAGQVEIMHRQAQLQQEHLRDVEGTIDTYRRILGLQPEDGSAVVALEELYRAEERWDDLADVYAMHLSAVDGRDDGR